MTNSAYLELETRHRGEEPRQTEEIAPRHRTRLFRASKTRRALASESDPTNTTRTRIAKERHLIGDLVLCLSRQ